MQRELSLKTAFYQKRHKRQKNWKKVFMILASVVVFCTTYALILPAITMEPDYICGYDAHIHNEDCYRIPEATPVTSLVCESSSLEIHEHTTECIDENGEPKCGIADFVLHSHINSCFDADGELVCSLPEIKAHIHADACWQQPHVHEEACYTQVQGELLCTIEEGSIHAHNDTCYTSRQIQLCELTEEQPHTHGDGCYTQVSEQICRLDETEGHTHSDSCYDESNDLSCTLPEIAGHTHTNACYQVTDTFTCELEETEGHLHSEACFETVQDLTCTLEADIAHTHTDACYSWTPQLTCDLLTAEEGAEPYMICEEQELYPHTHTSDCFASDDTLICTLLEVSEHIHNDTCFVITLAETDEPVLMCEMEVHEHTEDCIAPKTTTEGFISGDALLADGYYCGVAEHSHQEDSCYDENDNLMCTMAEHEHTWICELAPADLTDMETVDDWETTLPELQGNIAADLIAVAESQLGYEESAANYLLTEAEELLYYSRYGAWWDEENPYGDWNAKFISFCLNYAGITDVPLDSDVANWPDTLVDYDQWFVNDGFFMPIAADMVFFDTNNDGEADRAGIITYTDIENNHMTVIHERNGKVRERDYTLDDSDILGYARIPGNEPSIQIQPQPGEIIMPETFFYEDEWLTMTLSVTGCAALPENAVLPEGEMLPEPALTVRMLDNESNLYYQLFEAAQEHGEEGGLLGLTAMELQFWYGENLLDTSACNITAEITLKESLMSSPVQTLSLFSEEIAPEAETGVEVAVIQADGTQITGTDTAFFETGAPSPTMTFAVTNNVIAVATSQTANPSFTVQYYAYVDQFILSDSGTLDVINTDNGGVNQGGIMPQNGGTILKKYLTLNADGTVSDQSVLTRVYKDYQYQYIEAPNLTYFNRLFENGHYRLTNVWILKDGKSASSTTESDWNVYPADTHFTNRPENATQTGAILIEEGTVIRLIYEVTDGGYSNAANFYDYDITNGKIYDSSALTTLVKNPTATGSYYAKTDKANGLGETQGINSPANYGSGSKLAFGNANTRVGLERESWVDKYGVSNQLNEGNPTNGKTFNGGSGCTFSLANYLTKEGRIVYSNGVAAPKLFGEETQSETPPIGRTDLLGYQLEFIREGDTYTLSKVINSANSTVLSNLNRFEHPHSKYQHIWTNNFWPMDTAHNYVNNYVYGHDMKFGGSGGNKVLGVGAVHRTEGTYIEQFPTSDDFLFHNSYFGMQYAVNFELTADYVGPLEYLFFGDDDMWVFLSPADENGNITGNGTLVCDIGGVHSSVGQYVNLWDYIDRENRTEDQNYVLSFFYTERGASGSSCYMQFTLPSVSSATPEQTTGTLRVEKEVSGAAVDLEHEYSFTINFTDEKGALLQDDYAYTRHSSDGEIIGRDVIISTGGTFTLKHGEYIIVKYLPVGTKYSITEAEGDYVTTVSINGTIKEDATASGTIQLVKQDTVRYTNTFYYELPETGGGGAMAYRLMGSGMLLLLPILYATKRRYRGRRVNGG